MFHFFRKIKLTLLAEGKTGRYIKYAIGEIVLVVIGILIALQINNSNESRKDRLQEKEILSLLKSDFTETRVQLLKTINSQEQAVDFCKKLIQTIYYEDISKGLDSISIYFSFGAFSFYREEPVMGSYDALISSGRLSLVQNQELLKVLSQFSAEYKLGFEDEQYSFNLISLMHESSGSYSEALFANTNSKLLNMNLEAKDENLNEAVNSMLRDKRFLSYLFERAGIEQGRLQRQKSLLELTNNILKPLE